MPGRKWFSGFFSIGSMQIAAGAAVGGQHDLAALAGAHEAEPALVLVQLAEARAQVALHAAVVEPVPVFGRYGPRFGCGIHGRPQRKNELMNLSFKYRKLLLVWFLFCLGCGGSAGAEDSEPPWVLVDTEKLTLSLMRGERPELVMEDIAIGRNGTTRAKRRGDNRTPLGEFRIAWINWDSRFHRFIGLDYPNLEHGRRGFEAGRISAKQWRAIEKARPNETFRPRTPPGRADRPARHR